jgi:hypothetical protein
VKLLELIARKRGIAEMRDIDIYLLKEEGLDKKVAKCNF